MHLSFNYIRTCYLLSCLYWRLDGLYYTKSHHWQSLQVTPQFNYNQFVIYACCSDLGYTVTVCSNISSYQEENDAVQTRASEFNMYMAMLSSIPSMLVALFIGPWSDQNGRKPVLILPFIGKYRYFLLKLAELEFNFWRLCPYNCLLDTEHLLYGMASWIPPWVWSIQYFWFW